MLTKRVRFLVKPGEAKIPKLSKDLFIVYSGCPFEGKRGCEGECHNCMQGDLWPVCEVRLEFVGEVWREFFVLSAGGQAIEKRREIMKLRRWNSPWRSKYELLWRSPFSNSSTLDAPILLMGGDLRFQDADSGYAKMVVLVRTSWDGGWVFPEGFERVKGAI